MLDELKSLNEIVCLFSCYNVLHTNEIKHCYACVS